MLIRVLTWNLFHARDGHPAARADLRSTLLGTPVFGDGHLHLNRKLHLPMARALAALGPHVAALQEVPTAAIDTIVSVTGMDAIWVRTGPLIGPRRLRDRLARANPDLWRSHEGNANVLLVDPRVGGFARPARRLILNDGEMMWTVGMDARVPAVDMWHWVAQRRGVVAARLVIPGARDVAVACVHLHNGRVRAMATAEAQRALAVMRGLEAPGGAILAGDLNAVVGHPAQAALVDGGLDDRGPAAAIDRILRRTLVCTEPPAALPDSARTVRVPHRGRWTPVLLSDHAPVMGTWRLPAA
ncbi:MAG: endonuclease/exonuclease/phosphatase family protein [Miltoncostaeaceae bacterium]